MLTITVSWFSSGVSSAVATKLLIKQVDKIIYQHIDDQHPDTARFVRECERWFGKRVIIQQSPYRDVESVCLAMSYVNGPYGAPCTKLLKRRLRQQWEAAYPNCKLCYVWGLDATEERRADRIKEAMPEFEHLFPLIEKGITKKEAHGILTKTGIARPTMYELGYPNNNCVGCVKGGRGYWNKIREDFPKVFEKRAAMERRIGATCINGTYLAELPTGAGKKQKPIVPECGPMCDFLTPEGAEI